MQEDAWAAEIPEASQERPGVHRRIVAGRSGSNEGGLMKRGILKFTRDAISLPGTTKINLDAH